MGETFPLKYRAFLSYSHADTRVGKWLHGAIEGFPLDRELVGRVTAYGPVPKTLRPVFRDRDEFTAGHTLNEQTINALDQSLALVVLCTPASAKSHYVNEEVRLFKSRHQDRPVIPIIASGEPGQENNECFPPAMRFDVTANGEITSVPSTLLAADLRDHGDGKDLALAKVVARLIDLGTDDVFRRAQRAQRRRQRGWIAGLTVIALGLAGLAVWAEVERFRAERNFSIAKQGADALVFDIAQALRDQRGMRSETVAKLLGSAEQVFDKLVARSGGNKELLRSQSAMLNDFADTYAAQGDIKKQEAAARKSLDIVQKLVKFDPNNLGWQGDLCLSYLRVGDAFVARANFTEAFTTYIAATEVVERLDKLETDSSLRQTCMAEASRKAGEVAFAKGNVPEARKAYQSALAITQRLAQLDPDNAEMQHNLSWSHNRIGMILASQYDFTGALQNYRTSLAIGDKLVKSDPNNVSWMRDLWASNQGVGDMLLAQGDRPEAMKAYRQCLAISETLTKSDPANTAWQADLSSTLLRIGDVSMAQGDIFQAKNAYAESLSTAERLVLSDASNVNWQRNLSLSHMRSASLAKSSGDISTAFNELNAAKQIGVRLSVLSPNDSGVKSDLAWIDGQLAELGRSP